jgi:hypothetical protein
MDEYDQTYLKIAQISNYAYWYDWRAWIAKSNRTDQFINIQPTIRLFDHQTPSKQNVLLPVGQQGIIPSPQVWEQIKEKVDAFFAAYSEESLDTHNWKQIAEREEDNRSGLPEPQTGFVYLFQAGNIYKIGLSINPQQRAKTIRAPNEQSIVIEHQISTEDMYALENALHRRFSNKRLEGEWFELDPADVEYIKGL